jgi:hypothetical protein
MLFIYCKVIVLHTHEDFQAFDQYSPMLLIRLFSNIISNSYFTGDVCETVYKKPLKFPVKFLLSTALRDSRLWRGSCGRGHYDRQG